MLDLCFQTTLQKFLQLRHKDKAFPVSLTKGCLLFVQIQRDLLYV